MVAAIKQRVTVQPGGVIEIRSPELTPGASAEVIILVDGAAPPAGGGRPLVSFVGAGKGGFHSAEEIDAYVRELRDEWDR